MILSPTRVSTDRFTFVASQSLFVSEASDLPPLGRVYDDACDEGLTLVSAKTGREIVFAVNHVERDREGDVLYWDLKPVPGESQVWTVRIFND